MCEWILPTLNVLVLCLIFWLARGPGLVATLSGFSAQAPGASARFLSGKSRFSALPHNDTIYLLWGSNCHYCREFKDASKGGKWPAFKMRAVAQGLNVVEIQMDGKLSDADRAVLKTIGPIPGVPYVVRVSNGVASPYLGPRDDEPMMAWALHV